MKPDVHAFLLPLGLLVSSCNGAGAEACFIPETALPQRAAVLANLGGESQKRIADAAFDGSTAEVERLLSADRALGGVRGGDFGDLLSIAISRCDADLLSRLLALGLDPNGPAGSAPPLLLALRATKPAMAEALLKAGARADAAGQDATRPLDEAILIGSQGAVRLLLDHGADVNAVGKLGIRPLHVAIDSHRFQIAELLLERGADPWAADDSGGTLGAAVAKPSLSRDPTDDQARKRLADKVKKLGWPWPPPDWREIKALRDQGRWPPKS